MRILRWIVALLVAALSAYVVGVIINSQFVMNAHDVPITLGERLNMTAFDVSNMLLYFVIILIALLVGFGIAAIVKRFLPGLSSVAYPVAGAAAIGAALGLMYMQFQTIPISGARSAAGFAFQMVAGGIGGWVFAKLLGRWNAAKGGQPG